MFLVSQRLGDSNLLAAGKMEHVATVLELVNSQRLMISQPLTRCERSKRKEWKFMFLNSQPLVDSNLLAAGNFDVNAPLDMIFEDLTKNNNF